MQTTWPWAIDHDQISPLPTESSLSSEYVHEMKALPGGIRGLPGGIRGSVDKLSVPAVISGIRGIISWTRGMGLSPREVEIICYIMAERKDLFIARELGISYNTVRTQLSRLYKKLGVHSRTGVVVAVFTEAIRIMAESQAEQINDNPKQ